MLMKTLLLILFFFTSLSLAVEIQLKSQETQTQVIELYTSEGCSSCPPADRWLSSLKNNSELFKSFIPIALHVDYWDYIGWKDPFSQKKFTEKQRSYAQKFNDNRIYTPAVIVNGKEHFVGSNRSKMYTKIKEYKKHKNKYDISLGAIQQKKNSVKFEYTIDGDVSNTKARVVLAIKERITEVKRGENARRTLKNNNIVVSKNYLMEVKKTGNYTFHLPEIVTESDKLSVFLILENKQKDILSAQKLDF